MSELDKNVRSEKEEKSKDEQMVQQPIKGAMTVSQAGRKGGQKVAAQHGHQFYEEIGKKGGRKVAAQRGHAFYEEIGKKGGRKVAAQRGHAFYEEIGHKGGQKVKELIEKGKLVK